MEPLSMIAGAVTTYILPKALEKIGEKLGEASFERSESSVRSVQSLVSQKMTQSQTSGVLALATDNPSENNIALLQAVLVEHMAADDNFLKALVDCLHAASPASTQLQSVLEKIRVAGNMTVGNVVQTTDARIGHQVLLNDIGVDGDLTIGDISQHITNK
jgi:hypothetical protein